MNKTKLFFFPLFKMTLTDGRTESCHQILVKTGRRKFRGPQILKKTKLG